MDRAGIIGLLARYLVLIFLGVFITIFYTIFTPLTVYSSYFILSLILEGVRLVPETISFFNPVTVIFFKGYFAKIIPACVGGAAYYLLVILNLGTPMPPVKRVKSLAFLILAFLVLNVVRIVSFALIVPRGYSYFDLAHELTWYVGSTLMVVIIWFVNVFIFKIDKVPFYSDLKNLYIDSVSSANTKKGAVKND